jgi:hypothetical protein
MFGNYSKEMIRLRANILRHPWKMRQHILNEHVGRILLALGIGTLGFKPRRSRLSEAVKAEGVTGKYLDLMTSYQFERLNKETGKREVVSLSLPWNTVDKIINRDFKTTLKFNSGALLGLWFQLTDNRGFNGKPVTKIPMGELIKDSALPEKYRAYTLRDKMEWNKQMAWYAIKQYFPPLQDVEDWTDVITKKTDRSALQQLLNFSGLAYHYTFTKDFEQIKKEFKEERDKGEKRDLAKLDKLKNEAKRTMSVLTALKLLEAGTLTEQESYNLINLMKKYDRGINLMELDAEGRKAIGRQELVDIHKMTPAEVNTLIFLIDKYKGQVKK